MQNLNTVYQIPAVTPEQQFPEITQELENWKVGYLVKRRNGDTSLMSENTSLAFDRRKRMFSSTRGENNNNNNVDDENNNNTTTGAGFVDTIRMGRSRDQVHLSQFMHLNLPATMHDRQVTNFEVRRMMQRSRTSKLKQNNNEWDTSNNKNEGENRHTNNNTHEGDDFDDEETKRRLRQEILFGRRKSEASSSKNNNNNNNNDSNYTNQDSSNKNSASVSIVTKLSVMDPQVLHKKGKELTEMIQTASRIRAAQIPFAASFRNDDIDDSKNKGNAIAVSTLHQPHRHRHHEKPSDIQVWYHRLGMDPPTD